MKTAPSTKPSAVPATARSTLVPVVSALLRSTDIAPSTTQKPCWTGNTCVIGDGRGQAEPGAQAVAHHHRAGGDEAGRQRGDGLRLRQHPIGCPGLAAGRGRARAAHTGRASAAAAMPDDAAGRADARRDGATGQQPSSRTDRGGVAGFAEYLDDVVAVAALRHGPLLRRAPYASSPGARRGPSARDVPQHARRIRAAPARRDAHLDEQVPGVVGDAIGQPLQVVDDPDQRAASRGQPDRPEVGAEEVGAQRAHRGRARRRPTRCPPAGRPGSGTPARRACAVRRDGAAAAGTSPRARRAPARSASRAAVPGSGPGGVHAGSTNVSSVERCPAATISLSTPENVTATASTNIVVTASHGIGATSDAQRDQDGAVDAEAAVGERPRRAGCRGSRR